MTAFEQQQAKAIEALQYAFNECTALKTIIIQHAIPNHKNYSAYAAIDFIISASANVRGLDGTLYPLTLNEYIDKRNGRKNEPE